MDVNDKFNLGKFLKGFVSKKLIIWIIATVLVFMRIIDGTWWGIITAAYLGVNVTQDFILGRINKGKNNGISNISSTPGSEYRSLGAGPPQPTEGNTTS